MVVHAEKPNPARAGNPALRAGEQGEEATASSELSES
jgi:hypothetical protein